MSVRDLAAELELDTALELGESLDEGSQAVGGDIFAETISPNSGSSNSGEDLGSSSGSSYQLSIALGEHDVEEQAGYSSELSTSFRSSSLARHLEALMRPGGGEYAAGAPAQYNLRQSLTSLHDQLDEQMRVTKIQAKELSRLRGVSDALERERELLQRRLEDAKSGFGELNISNALAEELQRREPGELSVAEHVKLRVHELIRAFRGELEQTRVGREEAREGMARVTAAAEAQQREAQRAARIAADRETGLRVELEAAQSALADMTNLQQKGEAAAKAGREASREYDALMARCISAEKEVERLHQVNKSQADSLSALAESERQAQRRAGEAASRSSMLEMDKNYLEKERSAIEVRLERAEREGEDARLRASQLERSREELADELSTLRKKAADNSISSKEIQRIRDASASDLAAIKESSAEAHEREVQAVRESRAEALSNAERLRAELAALRRDYEQLLISRNTEAAAIEASLIESRNEAAVRSLELAQLSVLHEGKSSLLRQREIDVEMLRTQVDAAKAAFSQLEAQSSRELKELQHHLDAERAKMSALEGLELELDSAIVRAADENDGSQDSLAYVPTGQRRRIRHAMGLARRLLQRERQLDEAKRALQEAEAENSRINALLTALQSMASSQPTTAYMMEALREREEDAVRVNREKDVLIRKLESEIANKKRLQSEVEELRSELSRLTSIKQDAATLKCMLDALQKRQEVSDRAIPHNEFVAQQASMSGARSSLSPPSCQPRWYKRKQPQAGSVGAG